MEKITINLSKRSRTTKAKSKVGKLCQTWRENQFQYKDMQALLYLYEKCEVPWVSRQLRDFIIEKAMNKKSFEVGVGMRDCHCGMNTKPHRTGCGHTESSLDLGFETKKIIKKHVEEIHRILQLYA